MANSILSVLALLVLATFAAAQETVEVFRWIVPYEGPTAYKASVGDTIIFRWANGLHNVFIHPSMSCDLEGAIPVGFQPGTSYVFTEEDGSEEGTEMFFACDIGNGAHCNAGQWLTVKVFSGPAPGGSGVIEDTEAPTDAPVAPSTDAPVAPEVLPEPEPEVLPEVEPEPEVLPEPEPEPANEVDAAMAESASSVTSMASLVGLLAAALALVLV